MDINPLITDFINSIKERHPSWEVEIRSAPLPHFPDALIMTATVRNGEESYECPIYFDNSITLEKMKVSKDELGEWVANLERNEILLGEGNGR